MMFSLSRVKYFNGHELESRIFFSFLCQLVLIVFSSFRSTSVGTDTWLYALDFKNALQDVFTLEDFSFFSEFGYYGLKLIVSSLSDNFNVFLFFVASIIVFLYINTINELSSRGILSLSVFLFLGFYTFHFNALRQGIAAAILFFSIRYILRVEFNKYALCIFVGFLFHKSLIICLPVYFICRSELNFKKIFWIFFFLFMAGLFSNELVGYTSLNIDARYSGFGDAREDRSGFITSIFNFLLFLTCYIVYFKWNIKDDILYRVGLNMMLIGSLIGLISAILKLDPNGIPRLSVYFMQLSVFVIPSTVSIIRKENQTIAVILIVVVFLFYSHLTFNRFANLIPFHFTEMLYN